MIIMLNVVVTGAGSGLGLATAIALARYGASVVLVARDERACAGAVASVRAAVPNAVVDSEAADLSSISAVRRVAERLATKRPRLDVLVNNAGVARFRYERTVDGLEATFAVNHMAPFVLTTLLEPVLRSSAPARVINVSSEQHRQVRAVRWDELNSEPCFDGMMAYNVSKLFNVLFTRELAHRLGSGVTANAVSPGFLRTDLGRDARGAFRFFLAIARPFQSAPEVGAESLLQLSTSPDLAATTGAYFNRMREKPPSALACDDEAARRLWELSNHLVAMSLA
jgi:NAD(P)-dependent dehydrogenase (short-subunit alcohol dehydrogenase family)